MPVIVALWFPKLVNRNDWMVPDDVTGNEVVIGTKPLGSTSAER